MRVSAGSLIRLSWRLGTLQAMRVLIVEDELKMASLLRRGLVEEGHAADVAPTGEDAVWMAQSHPYEAIVLDVMLPGLSGFETCRQLRNAGVWAPVLMLTARDGVEDRVAGLDVGADDYLTKPFSFAELLARLRAGQVLSRLQLLEHAWDFAYENRSNVIDVYVRYIREKVDRPFGTESIETVRGVGYRLREDDDV